MKRAMFTHASASEAGLSTACVSSGYARALRRQAGEARREKQTDAGKSGRVRSRVER
jgi:hypothetical protein